MSALRPLHGENELLYTFLTVFVLFHALNAKRRKRSSLKTLDSDAIATGLALAIGPIRDLS